MRHRLRSSNLLSGRRFGDLQKIFITYGGSGGSLQKVSGEFLDSVSRHPSLVSRYLYFCSSVLQVSVRVEWSPLFLILLVVLPCVCSVVDSCPGRWTGL